MTMTMQWLDHEERKANKLRLDALDRGEPWPPPAAPEPIAEPVAAVAPTPRAVSRPEPDPEQLAVRAAWVARQESRDADRMAALDAQDRAADESARLEAARTAASRRRLAVDRDDDEARYDALWAAEQAASADSDAASRKGRAIEALLRDLRAAERADPRPA